MNSFRLALSFIQVPQLFFSLLLAPLLLGFTIALIQVVVSISYLKIITTTAAEKEREIATESVDIAWLRKSLFGENLPETPEVCIWSQVDTQGETTECELHPLDVVVRSQLPKSSDYESYQRYFSGSTPRIHFCQNCTSEIMIFESASGEKVSTLHSLAAVGVFTLKDEQISKEASKHVVGILESKKASESFEGTVYLKPAGFSRLVNLSETPKTMVLVFNAASLVVMALWLALKAHRRVLDYFAKNNALLPLVAACGKENFYLSLWLITMLRVSLFFLACVPFSIFMFRRALREEVITEFFRSTPDLLAWLLTIGASLAAVIIIASIGELKQRRPLHAFLFRYLPLALCLVGTLVWMVTLFLPGQEAIQTLVSCLPVVGVSPIILNPVFTLNHEVLALHAFLASILVFTVLRSNTRWFAAHLEEL